MVIEYHPLLIRQLWMYLPAAWTGPIPGRQVDLHVMHLKVTDSESQVPEST